MSICGVRCLDNIAAALVARLLGPWGWMQVWDGEISSPEGDAGGKKCHAKAQRRKGSGRGAGGAIDRHAMMGNMSPEEKDLRKLWKNRSNADLMRVPTMRVQNSREAHVAVQMVKERESRRKFWTTGLPGWVALALSALNFWLDWLARS